MSTREELLKQYQSKYLAVIKHFGTQEATAEELSVKQSTVNGWAKARHFMSAKTANRVQIKTQGLFSSFDLYPDETSLADSQTKTPAVT